MKLKQTPVVIQFIIFALFTLLFPVVLYNMIDYASINWLLIAGVVVINAIVGFIVLKIITWREVRLYGTKQLLILTTVIIGVSLLVILVPILFPKHEIGFMYFYMLVFPFFAIIHSQDIKDKKGGKNKEPK